MSDYSKMTAKELEKENQRLMKEKDGIRAEQRKIAAALDQRAAEAKIGALSDAEREALMVAMGKMKAKPPAQTLKAAGIAPKSKVGKPGGR